MQIIELFLMTYARNWCVEEVAINSSFWVDERLYYMDLILIDRS